MALVRSTNTGPERAVRAQIHALGVRFRLHNKDLPGSPDVANRKRRWAIFVNGCFWHAHAGCRRATLPKTNRPFWRTKLERNRNRDRLVTAELTARGYRVLTVWECELKKERRLRRRLEIFFAKLVRVPATHEDVAHERERVPARRKVVLRPVLVHDS
jgi:DNA mismatch endonuclease (patch repair protein)